jgi:outer membrane protein assembly factor BamE (lipoprotein component of BamABCDE complex)
MRPIFFASLAALLASCASPYAGQNLPQGSSQAEVQAAMGAPKETVVDSGGYTVWFYPTAPNGRYTYAARFMPDGRLVNVEQRLTKENFARVQPGATTQQQVHQFFGPPYLAWRMPFMAMTEWDYRVFVDNRFFDWFVRFSDDGVVREAYLLHDPVYDAGARSN